jgi:hypothetical protein
MGGKLRRRVVLTCYWLPALGSVAFGLFYLSRTEFLPYHADAAGLAWSEVEPGMQTLLVAVLRIAGAGFVTTGLAMTVLLLIPFRRGERWASWAVPLLGLVMSGVTLYAAGVVRSRTPGEPPLALAVAGVVLLLLGAGLALTERGSTDAPDRPAR